MAQKQRKRNIKRADVDTTLLTTAGTTMRLEKPASKRKPKASAADVAVVVAQEVNPIHGFVDFLKEYAVVGLSIGLIIGNQMTALVKVLTSNFIDPLSHLLFGTALSQRTFTLSFHGRIANFGWGGVIFAVLNIVLLLFFIYIAFKAFGLDKLVKPAVTATDEKKSKK